MKYLFLLIFCLGQFSAFAQIDNSFKTKVGQQVPLIDMETLTGESIALSDYEGKVVLLLLFGTRCPPCMQELPKVQEKLAAKYSKDQLAIIAIAATDDALRLQKFVDRKNFDFIFVPDKSKKVFKHFADYRIPRNIVLDPQGKIIFQSKDYKTTPFNNMIKLIEKELTKI